MLRRLRPAQGSQVVVAAILIGLLISPIHTFILEESSGAQPPNKAVTQAPVRDKYLAVSCHLLPAQRTWAVDQVPQFKVYVRHSGSEELKLVTNPDLGCMIEVDGRWYAHAEPQWVDGFGWYPSDWIAKHGGYLSFTLDPLNLKGIANGQVLKLPPGEYKVRFAWAEHERKQPSRVISKPVTITIRKPQSPLHPAANLTRERQVRNLFGAYLGASRKNTGKISEPLLFDIQTHSNWRPRFMWSDIPTLLEIAESKRVMKGGPSRIISSYISMECTEGMVALWLIEGLRRKQLDLSAREQGIQSYPGSKARWHYNLPLNPICRMEGMSPSECEKSADIHGRTLQAYKDWWRQVQFQPGSEAAAVNPLAGTAMTWFGGLHPMDKARSANSASERL